MSNPPVITVGGAKTYAATSEMQMNVTDFGNERIVNDILSNNQKSDNSLVKIAPALNLPRPDTLMAAESVQ